MYKIMIIFILFFTILFNFFMLKLNDDETRLRPSRTRIQRKKD